MKHISKFILIIAVFQLSAQKQDYNWILGYDHTGDPGAQLWQLDWNNEKLDREVVTLPYSYFHNNSSISDSAGNLLIATNGCAVFNRNYEVMPNGDSLNWDQNYREVLRWEDCFIGYPSAQNILILPDPSDSEGYYVVHKTFKLDDQLQEITLELRNSYVHMNLDGGYGDLTYKDQTIISEEPSPHHLEAIRHQNGIDWWILQPQEKDSLLVSFLIDSTGIQKTGTQNMGFYKDKERFGGGTSRFSPDGNYYAVFDYFHNLNLYDFDRLTGKISNRKYIKLFESENLPNQDFNFGSVEWSPNSRFIYVAISDSLMQVDTWENNIQNGVRLIDTYTPPQTGLPNKFYMLALAPDCKIYLCSGSSSKAFHVIHKPDELGGACNFVQEGLQFPHNVGGVFPLHPRFRLDQEEKCDPNITSVLGELVYWRKDLSVYPSPANEQITVEIPEGKPGSLYILDINGNFVYHKDGIMNTERIDVSHFSSGTYSVEFVPAINNEKVIYTNRLVVVD